MGGTRSDTETGRGGSNAAAEAHRDRRDPTAGERTTGGGAGVERGGTPTRIGKTIGRPGPDTLTGGEIAL